MVKWLIKVIAIAIMIVMLGFLVVPSDASARRGRKITISDEDAARIRGKIIRPELELVLQRSKINYDALKLKESFLPRIKRSVLQDVF